jgi:DNA-binding beta-propeller fold protein YncE
MKQQFFFPLVVLAAAAVAAEPPLSENSALRLVGKIPVPGMTGTWDHIGADGAGGRLFGNAQDIHTLEVLDLRTQRAVRAVTGPFNRNQGIAFLPDLKKIVISNGRSGLCVVLNSDTLEPGKSIGVGLGADLMAYDAATKLLYVDHGGRDSNRGFGAVAVIDLAKDELVVDIPTDLRPAAMAIE